MQGFLTSRHTRAAGLTDKYGWKFLRTAGLLSVAFMGIGVCVSGHLLAMAGYWINPDLTAISVMTWFIVMGMMLAQLLRPSKRVTRIMGGLAGACIIARIVLNYVHLGIYSSLQSLDIPWFYVVILFVFLISVSLGAYIQNEFGAVLYRGRIVKVALIVLMTMIGIMALMRSLKTLELSAFVRSSICSFNILASIFIPFSIAVLFRSRAAYRLTRPLVVKFVLVALTLALVFETYGTSMWIVSASPFVIALVAFAPTLVRRMVNDMKWL